MKNNIESTLENWLPLFQAELDKEFSARVHKTAKVGGIFASYHDMEQLPHNANPAMLFGDFLDDLNAKNVETTVTQYDAYNHVHYRPYVEINGKGEYGDLDTQKIIPYVGINQNDAKANPAQLLSPEKLHVQFAMHNPHTLTHDVLARAYNNCGFGFGASFWDTTSATQNEIMVCAMKASLALDKLIESQTAPAKRIGHLKPHTPNAKIVAQSLDN